MRLDDLTGKHFGRLTVLCRAKSKGMPKWVCLCSCGRETNVWAGNLKRGFTKSCGCFQDECRGKASITHGRSKTREHAIWMSAKGRCYNPRNQAFQQYGARGIRMCSEWRHSFQAFFDYMGPCPPRKTLERLDNNKGYEPGNVKWATYREQMNNQTKSRLLTHRGVTMTMAQWADRLGMPYHALTHRLYRGWTVERALTTPVKRHG